MMFDKRKKNIEPDNVSNIGGDFDSRLPCRAQPLTEYRLFEPFLSFTGYIDSYLEKLFPSRVDHGNGDSLIKDIDAVTGQTLADLDRQHVAHTSRIYALSNSRVADKTALQNRLEELTQELRLTQGELYQTQSRYRQIKFKRKGDENHA